MPHLIHPSDDSLQWDAYCNEWVGAPEEIGDPHPLNLPTGLDYHKLFIRKLGVEKDGSLGWNKYHGRVVFVLELIDDHTHTNRLIGSLYRMEEPPAFFSGILALTFKPRQLYLRYLSLPHPNFMRFDVFTDKPNKHGRNWVLIHEGAPFYVQPTVWNRWGPMAWFKWALGRPLPGDDGDKYYPQGYHTHDLGPKYFEGKGYKELEGFKETLRQQRMGQCPFQ